MVSIARVSMLAILLCCASMVSAMTINDLNLGKHAAGPNLTAKDLKGKVVFVVYWGVH